MPDASKNVAERAQKPPGPRRIPPTTFVSGAVIRGILVGFRSIGLSPEQICASLGRSLGEMMDPGARVPSPIFWDVWREAERLSGDPSLGLRLAENIPLAAAGSGMVGQLANVSETGLDAVRYLARYDRVVADRLEVQLCENETELSIEFTIAHSDPLERHVYEVSVGGTWKILDAATVAELVPVRVAFRHPPPPDTESYERFFGCPVDFRAPAYSLRLPLAALRQPMIAAQPRAESRLRDLLESDLRAIAPEFTVAAGERVRAAIESHERPTEASIAKTMGIGQRTLQRRLREEGSSFRRIVDRERRELALELLKEPGRRVVEVAHAVGFDDATSFSKAFRRWTGMSPTTHRGGSRG